MVVLSGLRFDNSESEVAYRATTDRRVLEVRGISTRIDGRLIVDSVSLSVSRGEVVGVVGANGSGKTTLVRTLAGLLDPDSGGVVVDGVVFDSSGDGASRRNWARKVAYMPQSAESHPFTA
ncbi:MAG: ATP-binding cassette domain-containing protein, partial [Chloroflexi bacterium]|nr:ATP-binding cassette domain-containing protein [Chloroflexota bacterium]